MPSAAAIKPRLPRTATSQGHALAWLAFAMLLMVAPVIFSSATSVSLLSQMGMAAILGLSYNMLLGQGGMLSFGHAVYSGLGAFMSVHFMNLAGKGALWLPLPLVPLVGGVTGLCFAAVVGYVITRKSGTTFAMITLGIGEMVFACSLMFPGFFGGEGGVSTNRVYGRPFFGATFGPQVQVYYLIAAWVLLCTAGIYAFTRTPLGRMLNAVRDNAERVAFVGYAPRLVRYFTLVLSGFYAGVAGSLGAINFEIATAENISATSSGAVLLFTFIGGVSRFAGPMIGAVVGVLMTTLLPDYTQAWHLYLGLLFVLVVVYAPGGLSSLVGPALRFVRANWSMALLNRIGVALLAGVVLLAGTVATVELLYHRSAGTAGRLMLYGIALDPARLPTWLCALGLLALGVLTIKPSMRRVAKGARNPGRCVVPLEGAVP
ncbi:MAG: branched-chain amino acid ABC transporter permease [Burkholderiaceae bacterium]|jgi:branched-chain amino acid transport system permease protein|nr:branched-chain amino acid ABC transporter permease [Burkholderiaceae bacterium]